MMKVVCGVHVEEDFDAVSKDGVECREGLEEDPIVMFFPNQTEIARRQRNTNPAARQCVTMLTDADDLQWTLHQLGYPAIAEVFIVWPKTLDGVSYSLVAFP